MPPRLYYPEKGLKGLRDELRSYLDCDYRVCKMRIGGASLAKDIERIEAAIAVVGAANRLAVDAN